MSDHPQSARTDSNQRERLAAVFLTALRTVFFAAPARLATVLRAVVFFAAVFLGVVFFAAVLRAVVFFAAAVFFAAGRVVFFAAVFFAAVLRAAVLRAVVFFAAVLRAAFFAGVVIALPPRQQSTNLCSLLQVDDAWRAASTRHADLS